MCSFFGSIAAQARRKMNIVRLVFSVLSLGLVTVATAATEPPGMAVYREHCSHCHGDGGRGTEDYPEPLAGSLSVNQLAAYIDQTMPEDDPTLVTGDRARQVAEAIHSAFYSTIARERNKPVRQALSRLTVRQMQETLADLVGSFRNQTPPVDDRRGLKAEYFSGRGFDRKKLALERVDPEVQFDFGIASPDANTMEPKRFSIRWTGSVVPPETGRYEFIVRSEHSVKLYLNCGPSESPTIDAYVKSGDDTEFRASVDLLGGRPYPLRLEFSKANQGVDKPDQESESPATIELCWKPPHGVVETVPERCLLPTESPESFVLTTPFPPDDAAIGYERGTSISPEWLAATTAAAIETADYCLVHIDRLARVKRNATDREAKLKAFAATFAERAFRRPLSNDLNQTLVAAPFATAPDLDTGLKRSLLLALTSPRFLYRQPALAAAGGPSAFDIASQLSFGLWDSLPDAPLAAAARNGQLTTPKNIRQQAERMLADRRTHAKLHDFLFSWLRVDHGPEIIKNQEQFGTFSPPVAAAMRTSLSLLLEEVVWGEGSDFRRLFTHDEVFLDGTLAPLFGLSLPADAPFQSIRLDDGKRSGLVTHPYMLSVLAYTDNTSPIHRGVFLARSVLGNVLKPPKEAVAPLAADLHPDLTTRQRVAVQTKPAACQTCHTMINPLGFALEDFDAIGRHRTTEQIGQNKRPIDASGGYQPRVGDPATFTGGRELGAYLAVSRDAAEAFVQNLFHAVVKQPVRAWGPESLEQLVDRFIASDYSIRKLLIEILLVATSPAKSEPVAA
jgi:mono/diheme cytochrome c family protein